MSANKTRVQVRGTIGKSIRIPSASTVGGSTIGVDFKLPDGSVPTLQQLAAALNTGGALQDQPGNIVPPGGGPMTIWQNVQYVPVNVLNPARNVFQEEDAGEEYGRMAVPGPMGVRGPQGFSGAFADDAEDPQPGPPGAAGTAGAPGAPGVFSTVHMYPDDAEDPGLIPGATGPAGQPGASIQGSPGINIAMWPDDAEDPGLIPGASGPAGAPGLTGPAGVISTVHLYPDDAEDPGLIPGATGPAGATGLTGLTGGVGAPGVPIYFAADDPEDHMPPVPGPQGQQGIQGIPGTSSSSSGGGGGIMPDDEDVYRPEQPSVIGGDLTVNGKLTVRGGMVPSDTFTYSYYGGL